VSTVIILSVGKDCGIRLQLLDRGPGSRCFKRSAWRLLESELGSG